MDLNEEILEREPRKENSHKGDHGKVLLIAGSEEYAGAAVLTSTACEAILRSGADLVVACCPEKVAWLVNNKIPDAIVKKFSGKSFGLEHVEEILVASEKCDIVLIGPGIGRGSVPFAKEVIEKISKPKVVDADAIRAVELGKINNSVITAHADEFKTLLENSGLSEDNYQESMRDNVLLLKGHVDKVVSKEKTARNTTGNPVMTKGGTGDVLAGLVAGFLAQRSSLFDSACVAAYLNGAVGDVLQEERGSTFIASDIVENLHRVKFK